MIRCINLIGGYKEVHCKLLKTIAQVIIKYIKFKAETM